MNIFDITLPVSKRVPTWPGDPEILVQQIEAMDKGSSYNLTYLHTSAHSGTHVDAPHHFLNNNNTVEDLPLEVLTGSAYVAVLRSDIMQITAGVLDSMQIPLGVERLLFKTRNSKFWANGETEFQTDYTAVVKDGAEWLVTRGIRLVGIDYLSIAPFKDGTQVHRILLNAGMVIVEGLDLSKVSEGRYQLYCLPIKLVGADGAPARAILIR
ncbi:MAG: cyclase family protein [Anaerolineales bacterium]|nr:cyclase family protein [Anaerolineales bacterium]